MESDASLFVVYPPLTCFAGRKQTFHLQPSANLFLVDWVTSGKLASEDSWKFSVLNSSTKIYYGADLVVKEELRPSSYPATRAYTTQATVFIIGPSLIKYAARFMEQVNAKPLRSSQQLSQDSCKSPQISSSRRKSLTGEAVSSSASEIRVMEGSKLKTIGASVKISSTSTQAIEKFLSTSFNALWQDTLGEDPYKI